MLRKGMISISPVAFDQIELIQQNDFTLEDHLFRVTISGKGCEGFAYSCGFTLPDPKDVRLQLTHPQEPERSLTLLFDPFTAHFFQDGRIDYAIDPETQADGFMIINAQEENYRGKFFKDKEMLPVF